VRFRFAAYGLSDVCYAFSPMFFSCSLVTDYIVGIDKTAGGVCNNHCLLTVAGLKPKLCMFGTKSVWFRSAAGLLIFVCRAAKQRGWWRITNPEVFKELNNCLNVRGIREKNLQKSFERHVNFAIQSCSKAKKNGLFLFFYFFTRVDIIAQCTSVGCFIPVLTTFKMSLCALLTSE
jgi:hypothetical protein